MPETEERDAAVRSAGPEGHGLRSGFISLCRACVRPVLPFRFMRLERVLLGLTSAEKIGNRNEGWVMSLTTFSDPSPLMPTFPVWVDLGPLGL